jgi:hypothetical protein
MDIFYFETRNDYFVQELGVGKPSSFYTTFTSNYVQTGPQVFIYYFLWLCSPARAMASSFHEVS